MRRISTATKVVDKFGAGKHGFTNGNASTGIPATDLEADLFDHLQEEIANVVEDLGVALDPNNRAQLLAALKGRLINVQVFTASGTYTPTPGTKSVVVEVQGGGGGGGGSATTGVGLISVASGGNAGAYGKSRITSGFSGAAVTVGAGGAGGVAAVGSAGGTSSFGALVSAPGGAGGVTVANTAPPYITGQPGNSAVATGANISNETGGVCTTGAAVALGSVFSGSGGNSKFGGGASGVPGGAGVAAVAKGSGGSGSVTPQSSAAANGGAGAAGVVIVWEYA